MLKSLAKMSGLIAGLLLSGASFAVSMGSINVTSALGEPLKAEIALTDVGKSWKGKVSARMASSETFREAGLDYSSSLPKLKFQIETAPSGEPYLSVTSTQPVNDPYVNLLVELTWPSGKLMRAYTFLLDPPGFKPEQPKAEQVQPLAPAVAVEPKAEPKAETPIVEQKQLEAPAPEQTKPAPAPAAKPEMKPAPARNVASGSIEVKRGDTLSKIASDAKPSDVSLERMLVAMYRANEEAFDGRNMNRLRTGKILRLPEGGELDKLEQAEAVKEIRAQVADWQAYRQQLAAAGAPAPEQSPRQEASGKITAMVGDKTPSAREPAKDVVRLSKGEAPSDKAAAAAAKSAQDKLHAMQEDSIAKDKMLKESQQRIVMLEKNIKEMQRLLDLKAQASKPAETKPAESKPAETKPVEMAAPVTVSAVAPAAPAPKPAHKTVAPPPPPSLVDEILGEPLYLAGGAAVLLGLGAGGFMLSRRRKGATPVTSEAAVADAHITAPVTPSPDTGDYTAAAGAAVAAVAAADEVDPIKEAELFLSFGRDTQAEDILKDALISDPDNQQIRLKLLSIYANRKDVAKFGELAMQVHDSGNIQAWEQAAEMGRRVDPGNALYGAAEEGAAMADDESTAVQTSTNLDFDLGIEASAETPAADIRTTSTGLDFDVSAMNQEAAPEEAPTPVPADEALDFDLGMETAPAPEAEAPQEMAAAEPESAKDAALDFDISAEYPGAAPQEEQAAEPAAVSADDLIFDVTAAHPAMEETPAEPAGLGEISLDFPGMEEPAAEEAPQQAPEPDLGLGEISLELEPTAPAAAAAAPVEEAKDARWHDVATKLDLARAYQEMGDAAGAREILQEVVQEGDDQQRAMAQAMIQQL